MAVPPEATSLVVDQYHSVLFGKVPYPILALRSAFARSRRPLKRVSCRMIPPFPVRIYQSCHRQTKELWRPTLARRFCGVIMLNKPRACPFPPAMTGRIGVRRGVFWCFFQRRNGIVAVSVPGRTLSSKIQFRRLTLRNYPIAEDGRTRYCGASANLTP